MQALDTARLQLPPLQPDDSAVYCALYCSADVMRHIGTALDADAAPRSFARALRYNAESPWQRRFWSMRERDGDATVGLLALSRVDDDAAAAEIGAMLLPAYQARGYAAEAITRLVAHAFADPAIEQLITRHVAANPLAMGLMRKLGFGLEQSGDACLWRLQRAAGQGEPPPHL
jgi:[ribosomal protein S5]-alanine N-acetyltransferase